MAAQLSRTNWRHRVRFGTGEPSHLVLIENDSVTDKPVPFLTLIKGFGLYQRGNQGERRRERDAAIGEGKQVWMARLDAADWLSKELLDRVRWFECAGCEFKVTDNQFLERRDKHWEIYGQLVRPAGS